MDIKCLVIKYIFLFVWILIGNKEYIICIFFLLKNLYMFSRNFIVLNYILIFIFNCKLFFFYIMFVVCDDLVNLFILLIIDIVN